MDRALLIGINKYRDVPDLRGCVPDVADARDMLVETMGFAPGAIRTITDADAVRPNVLDGLRWLADAAEPKARLFLHISGHGSYTADDDGDEPDGYDEVICLHDMAWGDPKSFLRDDELRRWAEALPPVHSCVVVLDTCHSGTGLRLVPPPGVSRTGHPWRGAEIDLKASLVRATMDPPPRSRDAQAQAMHHETRVRFAAPPVEVEARALARGQPKPKRSISRAVAAARANRILLLAACLPRQTAADAWWPALKRYQGAHTRAVCDTFRANPRITTAALRKRLLDAVAAGGFEQVPQIEEFGASPPKPKPSKAKSK